MTSPQALDIGPARRLVAELGECAPVWCAGLRKQYARRTAVHDVGFTVEAGEVVGLLGPNGAGKTTVIKMLLGLVAPSAGEVLLFGRPPSDPASREKVGYLPELFRYQPWLTPAEVLGLHARLSGRPTALAPVAEALDAVGLGSRAGDRVGSFSKGMQQRLGLAVALVTRPALVVLDEPTSALDPLGRADVRDLLLRLRADGVAVLLNSHLIGEVERVCDRVVVLDGGLVAAAGTLDDLLGRREVRLRLAEVSLEARACLETFGEVRIDGPRVVVALRADRSGSRSADVPDGVALSRGTAAAADELVASLVAQLVSLGVGVHEVQPGRISLEDRLLGILRPSDDKHRGEP